MKRTKLKDRTLPDYTRGEEIFNMVSHIVGGGFGVIALVTCLLKAVFTGGDPFAVAGSLIYGISMIVLYTMSSVYHGLRPPMAKKVFQIIDHCTIFILIAGTYTPILLTSIRKENPLVCWGIFAVVWGASALGATLNAIDLKKYNVLSMILYLVMGWCIIFTGKTALAAMGLPCFLWILGGGVSYTVGAVFYGVAKKVRYMHSIFHLFVVLGSILQYIGIIFYII